MPARPPSLKTLDRAHTCFLVAGGVSVVAFTSIIINLDNAILWGFWMVYLFPVVLGLFYGIAIGLLQWPHRPLLFLALWTGLFIAVGVIYDKYDVPEIAGLVWGIVIVIVPVWWFASGRGRYKEALGDSAAGMDNPMKNGR